jgi:signal transduction histidine kinase
MSLEVQEFAAPQLDEKQFVADLFHALNQPLSALRCMLDLAIHSPRTPADYQEYFKVGLEKVELANLLTQSMREFLEAKDASDAARPIAFQECLREVVDHFLPVAQSAGVSVMVRGEAAMQTFYDRERLRKTLLYLFDLSFHFIRGEALEIQIAQQSSQLIFSFAFDALESEAEKLWTPTFSVKEPHWRQRLQWIIAQQLLRSEHGDLRLTFHDQRLRLAARLPLIQPAI